MCVVRSTCCSCLEAMCVLGCFATRPTGLLVSRYGWLVHIVLLCLPLVLVFPELHRMDYTSTMFEASELGSLCGHVVLKLCVCGGCVRSLAVAVGVVLFILVGRVLICLGGPLRTHLTCVHYLSVCPFP